MQIFLPDKPKEFSLLPSKNLSDWSLLSFDILFASKEPEFCISSLARWLEKLSFFAKHWNDIIV